MKIKYEPDSDILIMILREDPPVDAIEEPGGVIVSYGEDKEPVSFEFLNAALRKLIQPEDERACALGRPPSAWTKRQEGR